MRIRRLRIACWIHRATSTNSEYVILTAFPLQQWLLERALRLRCTYPACLVTNKKVKEYFCLNIQGYEL